MGGAMRTKVKGSINLVEVRRERPKRSPVKGRKFDALKDVPVLLTATGGGLRHALVVEHHLRPLFGFFEALTIPTVVYASESDFIDGILVDGAIHERASAAAAQLSAVLSQRFGQASSLEPVRLTAVR